MKRFIPVLLSILLLGVAACGEEEELTMEEKQIRVCDQVIYCGVMDTRFDCEQYYRVFLHSEACLDLIIEGGCSVFYGSGYAFDLCYPSCSGSSSCSGAHLEMCNDGHRATVDCRVLCIEAGQSYIDCDRQTPDGNDVGIEQCWCSGWDSCTGDTIECVNSETIRGCVDGLWRVYDCDWICEEGDYDHSTGCSYSSDSGHDVCWCV